MSEAIVVTKPVVLLAGPGDRAPFALAAAARRTRG